MDRIEALCLRLVHEAAHDQASSSRTKSTTTESLNDSRHDLIAWNPAAPKRCQIEAQNSQPANVFVIRHQGEFRFVFSALTAARMATRAGKLSTPEGTSLRTSRANVPCANSASSLKVA